MSVMTTPSRVFRTALQRMRRNGWHTISALAVMTLTFFILSLFILTVMASNKVLHYFEQQPQVSIYLEDDVTQQRVDEIRSALEATGKAKTIKYTSKEEALAFFKEQMKDNPVLLENVSANVLPASLEVSPNNLADLPELVEVAQDEKFGEFIEEVIYQQDITERLASWTSTGRLVGLVLIIFLVVVSLLIMLVTIGVNISAYKEEIEVMRLVGASSWYIQGPFVLEGIMYGVFASIFSVFSTITRFFMAFTISALWVTINTVVPQLLILFSNSTISHEVVGSRFPVGSSASNTVGSCTKARAIATRCCSPPESWRGKSCIILE